LPWDQATELLLLLLPGSLALVLLLLLLLPNLAAEPFAAAAAVVVDVVGAAHVGVVADAGNAKREAGAGAGAGAVVVVLFVVAVAVVDDDDSKCVAAGDWGGCEPMKAREKSHERARKADEVQEDAASCPTETVGPHSLHTAPEIASSISLSLSLSLFVALLLLFFKILHTITMCCSFKLRYTCTYFTLSLSMHQISKQSYSAIIAASIAAAAPPPPPPLPTPPPPFTPSHFLPFFITIINQSDAATTPSHLLRLPLFSIISIISQSDAATPPSHHHLLLLLPLFSLIMIMIIKSITSTQRWS
jgi:hypothetical protein